MAWDIFKQKSTTVDHARGEPPPADSIEWAGIPQSAANMMAGARTQKPTVVTAGTEVQSQSKKPLLWVVGGFVVGLITGSWGRRD